jgi:hypothetical protein
MLIGKLGLQIAPVLLIAMAVCAATPPAYACQQTAGPAQAPAPKLVIESATHDFGEVKAGTPVSYSFIVKNEGTADLQIKSVAPA